jgi:hypothetical protein
MNVKAFLPIGLLLGSIISTTAVFLPSPAYASHEDITVTTDDNIYKPGYSVVITGVIDNPDKDIDEATITVRDAENDVLDDADDEIVKVDTDDGDFDFSFDLPNNAVEGRYKVIVEYGDADDGITFFKVRDNEDDAVAVKTNDDEYSPGDRVEVRGTVADPGNVDLVEVTLYGPDGAELDSDDPILENDGDFDTDFDLDDSADHGRYSVRAEYSNDKGWYVFEVTEDSLSDPITADTNKNAYEPGSTVELTGQVDVRSGVDEVQISVVNPDNDEIIDDEVIIEDNGDFEFSFPLDDDADEGTYTIVITYDDDDLEVTFTVDDSGIAGEDTLTNTGGITVNLDKTSYLAGQVMTITGEVKRIAGEELVYIHIIKPDKLVAQVASTEVKSDKTYRYQLRLKSDLSESDEYKIKVTYNIEEIAEKNFAIKGTTSTGADITVRTDKKDYASSDTVTISGRVSTDIIETGKQVLIRVDNPEGAAYRIDPVSVSADGLYSYEMRIGGKLGLPGEYEVTVTYGGDVEATTTFNFGETTSPTPPPTGKTSYNLRVEEDTYPIEYELSGGVIDSISIPKDQNDNPIPKLVIRMDAEEEGQLTVVLPREVIDAIEDGDDIDFVVTVEDADGNIEMVEAEEIENTDDERTLVIDVPAGADRIEIAGTQVVPEFGEIAPIILVATMVALVALIATARLGKSHLGSLFGKSNHL